jgi:predicted secreted hydrolase
VKSSARHRLHLLLALLSLLAACDSGHGPDRDAGAQGDVPGSTRLSGLLGNSETAQFERALEPRVFSFPADHGPHRDYRNEWWYVTGNLDAMSGERFGFELTLFRFSMSPQALETDSAWRTDQIYIGHYAITDVASQSFRVAQRYARGALGLAGATRAPFRVWLEDWQIRSEDGEGGTGMPLRLEAADGATSLSLTLSPRKPVVLNGDQGLSRKSAEPGNASYYYSLTRLETEGVIAIDGRAYDVSGLSWLDREWSSSALAGDQAGWDWFALQLDDGTELMYYQLRRIDGSSDPMSAGTFVDQVGNSVHLQYGDVLVEVLEQWESPLGGRYPARWRIRVPSRSLDVTVAPVLAAQELATTVRYWEGAVDVDGTAGEREIAGRGYVELTGYAEDEAGS